MYATIFGNGPIELENEFDRMEKYSTEEYENQLKEVPDHPYDFCASVKASNTPASKIMDFKTGTTTLGFVTKDGVILAVDSRATMGNFITSETVRKVIEISSKKLSTIAGGAADCQYWEAWLGQQVRMFELRHGKEPSVAATSRIMVNLINEYKRYGLSMGMMLAGVDDGVPSLYYINTEGSRIKGNMFSVGSGMCHAYGVLDSEYRFDLPLQAAIQLGRKAIYHATNKDTASGGYVRVYHVHNEGWTEKVAGDDVNVIHYEYQAQKGFQDDKSRGKI